MTGKRKAPASGSAGANKKLKSPPHASTKPKRAVHWAVSAEVETAQSANTRQAITKYGPILFGTPWEELTRSEEPFGLPRIRSPIFKGHSAKVMKPGSDGTQSSKALCDFFELIKKDTQPTKKGVVPPARGPYTRNGFEGAFRVGDKVGAVIVSRSTTTPIVSLTQDYRLDITINQHDGQPITQTAPLNIVRKLPGSSHDEETMHEDAGYFLDLQPGTSVTVNGNTYVHVEEARNGPHEPFFIGPLLPFTVIEFLSQPLFFYRSGADLDYTGPLAKGAATRPSVDELRRRDTHGNVDIQHVQIAWTPLSGQVVGPTAAPVNVLAKEQNEGGKESDTFPEEEDRGDEEEVYDDDWVDEGGVEFQHTESFKSILDPDSYEVNYAMVRVLMAINERQPDDEGFGVILNNHVYRPGRPLIIPTPFSPVQDNMCLWIIRVEKGAIPVRMYILDPMAWNKSRKEHLRFSQNAKAFIKNQGREWLKEVFGQDQDPELVLADSVNRMPCPQVTTPDMATSVTILSGWAMAMGYAVNPAFTLATEDERAKFNRHVKKLVSLSRDPKGFKPQLHWKLVLAFLRHCNFIIPSPELPEINRRFDTRKRKYREAEEIQKTQHKKWQASKKRLDLTRLQECSRLIFADSRSHKQKFLLQPYDEVFRQRVVKPLIEAGLWTWEATNDELELALQKPTNSPKRTEPRTETTDSVKNNLPALFLSNPCGYLQNALASLREAHPLSDSAAQTILDASSSGTAPEIEPEEVLRCISAVVHAINGKRSLINKIGLIDNLSPQSYSGGKTFALMPWSQDGHTVLVVLQAGSKKSPKIKVHVLDSAPWRHGTKSRNDLHSYTRQILKDIGWIKMDDGVSDGQKVSETMWVFGAPQTETWQAGHYTVLNAFAILLGLQLDTRFIPNGRFRREFIEIMEAAKSGQADWLLISSFLRCIRFADATDNLLCESHQFERTSPVEIGGKEASGAIKDAEFTFSAAKALAHDNTFLWDSFGKDDRAIIVPALQRAGRFRMDQPRDRIREIFPLLEDQLELSTQDFPEIDRACKYFRETTEDLLRQPEVEATINKFPEEAIKESYTTWLDDEELVFGIACVTQAISKIQNNIGGFGIWNPMQFLFAQTPEELSLLETYPVRFGKPIMLPLQYRSHFVLAVIQLDKTGRMNINVVDSSPTHYSAWDRKVIFKAISQIIEYEGWGKDALPETTPLVKPKCATWVPCAQQANGNVCGWHTILNAWALALGLEINPNFNPIYDQTESGFFKNLRKIVQIARAGYADWRLIYAFLRCHRFVHEGTVPAECRFTRTVQMMDTISLQDQQQLTASAEEEYLAGRKDIAEITARLRLQNAVYFPPGVRHDSRLNSSSWDEFAHESAPKLAEIGRLRLNPTGSELNRDNNYRLIGNMDRKAAKNFGELRATMFFDQLADHKKPTHEKIVSLFADYVLQPAARKYMSRQFERLETTSLLKMEQWELSKKVLIHLHGPGKELVPKNWKIGFTETQINLAIASVVQAIDRAQANRHQLSSDTPFAGGFTLALPSDVANAREIATNTVGDDDTYTSRPRRPWLLPLNFNSNDLQFWDDSKVTKKGGPEKEKVHNILAVVEEVLDQIGQPTFQIHVLDSQPQILQRNSNYVYQRVIQTAYNLNWPMHRDSTHINFEHQTNWPSVASQATSKYIPSSLHTILNAWILALGLTPNPKASFLLKIDGKQDFNMMYTELYLYIMAAVSGVLQWHNLVAYLVTNRYVLEKISEAVKPERDFGVTARQTWDATLLKEYIERVHEDEDQVLLAYDETEAPYDMGNLVDWSKASVETQQTVPPQIPVRLQQDVGNDYEAELDARDLQEQLEEEQLQALLQQGQRAYDFAYEQGGPSLQRAYDDIMDLRRYRRISRPLGSARPTSSLSFLDAF